MKTKLILLCGVLLMVGIASATLISLPYYPPTLPNGTNISDIPNLSNTFVITGLINHMQNENMNVNNLYYKAIVPNDNDNEWNLSLSFMERKPSIILIPYNGWDNKQPITGLTTIDTGITQVFACCNITKGDLLYTANASNPDGSFNIMLAGTLTNNYGKNWKTRVYNSSSSSWGNVNVGASTNPDVYNRRAKLHSDGMIVGYAMESVNVSTPTLIKIYKV